MGAGNQWELAINEQINERQVNAPIRPYSHRNGDIPTIN